MVVVVWPVGRERRLGVWEDEEGGAPSLPCEHLVDRAPSDPMNHNLLIWRLVGGIWSYGDQGLDGDFARVAFSAKITTSLVSVPIGPIWQHCYTFS